MKPADPRRKPSPERREPPGTGARSLTCQDVIGLLLLDYLEEALSPDAVADFERHLQDCAPCRAYLKTYARTRRLTGEVTRVAMPQELKTRLRVLLLERLRSGRS